MARFAAIFDLDGTLLDTLGDLTNAVNAALSALSLPLRTRDEVRSFIGNGVPTLVRRALPEGKGSLHGSALELFTAYYMAHIADSTRPFDGIPALLRALKNEGAAVAVVSNKKDEATRALCDRFFGPLIDYAAGARNDTERKPAPDMLLRALGALGSDRDSAVYIGDSDTDIAAARAAGLRIECVGWGYRTRDFLLSAGARSVAETPEELFDAVTRALFAGKNPKEQNT